MYLFQFVIRTFQLQLYVAPCRDVTILAQHLVAVIRLHDAFEVVRFVPFQRQPVVAVHRYPLLGHPAEVRQQFLEGMVGKQIEQIFSQEPVFLQEPQIAVRVDVQTRAVFVHQDQCVSCQLQYLMGIVYVMQYSIHASFGLLV